MNQLQELEEQYKKLGAEIEKLKASAVEAEVWPKKDDEYWRVTADGHIRNTVFIDGVFDRHSLSTNNCHRTKEAAEAHRAYQMDPRVRARELVELCEGFDVGAPHSIRYCMELGLHVGGEPGFDRTKEGYFNGMLAFESIASARAAIDKLGEDIIKVALGIIVGDEAEAIVREAVSRV